MGNRQAPSKQAVTAAATAAAAAAAAGKVPTTAASGQDNAEPRGAGAGRTLRHHLSVPTGDTPRRRRQTTTSDDDESKRRSASCSVPPQAAPAPAPAPAGSPMRQRSQRVKLLECLHQQVDQACREHKSPAFPTCMQQVPAFCESLSVGLFEALDQLLATTTNPVFRDLVRLHHGLQDSEATYTPGIRFQNVSPFQSRTMPPITAVGGSWMNSEQTLAAIEWPSPHRQNHGHRFQALHEQIVRDNVRLIVAIGSPSWAEATEAYWTDMLVREPLVAETKRQSSQPAVVRHDLVVPQQAAAADADAAAPAQGQQRQPHSLTLVRITQWPDHDAPSQTLSKQLTAFVCNFASMRQSVADPSSSSSTLVTAPPATTWVHCRAGVGRTGTLLFMVAAYERLLTMASAHSESLVSSAPIDLLGIWVNLRMHRVSMIQTREQLRFALSWAFDQWLGMFQLPPASVREDDIDIDIDVGRVGQSLTATTTSSVCREDSGRSLFVIRQDSGELIGDVMFHKG